MFPAAARLTTGEAQKLEGLLKTVYAKDAIATAVAIKRLNGFKDWVDAAHYIIGMSRVVKSRCSPRFHLACRWSALAHLLFVGSPNLTG
jgi:hypothetical protein